MTVVMGQRFNVGFRRNSMRGVGHVVMPMRVRRAAPMPVHMDMRERRRVTPYRRIERIMRRLGFMFVRVRVSVCMHMGLVATIMVTIVAVVVMPVRRAETVKTCRVMAVAANLAAPMSAAPN